MRMCMLGSWALSSVHVLAHVLCDALGDPQLGFHDWFGSASVSRSIHAQAHVLLRASPKATIQELHGPYQQATGPSADACCHAAVEVPCFPWCLKAGWLALHVQARACCQVAATILHHAASCCMRHVSLELLACISR